MALQKTEHKKVVEPGPIDVVLLDEIAGRLADLTEVQQKILTHLQETTAEGVDVPLPEKTVTDITTIDLIKDYPYRHLRSIDFFNKGPNTFYYRINEDAKEIPVEDRESITAERPKATIAYLTLRVTPNRPTTVKMIGYV